MGHLCPTCQKKPRPLGTFRGTCTAKKATTCKSWTDDFALTLCEPCATELEQCAWCLGPIKGGKGVEVPTTKDFNVVFEGEAGKHVTDMDVGKQICVQMVVDPYQVTWELNRYKSSAAVSLFRSVLTKDPQNYRQAKLEIYIDLTAAAESAKIVLEEKARWGGTIGKTWECTVHIRT